MKAFESIKDNQDVIVIQLLRCNFHLLANKGG